MAQAKTITSKRSRKSIITQYKKGKTLAELGDQYGVAATTIRNYLMEDGVVLRRRGGRSK